MVLPVQCPHRSRLEISNCQGPHQYGFHRVLSSFWIFLLFNCSKFCLVWNQDIKSEINPVLNPRAAGPEGSLIGIHGMLC
jgi:hypothetical protein